MSLWLYILIDTFLKTEYLKITQGVEFDSVQHLKKIKPHTMHIHAHCLDIMTLDKSYLVIRFEAKMKMVSHVTVISGLDTSATSLESDAI